MKYILTPIAMLIACYAAGQSKYLLDSFIFINNIENQVNAKTYYTYDEEYRLKGIQSDNNFSEIIYPTDSTRITTTYSYDNPNDYFLKRMDILDENSFVKIRLTSTLVDGLEVVEIADTVHRTADGTTHFRKRYLINENELRLETNTLGSLNVNNLLDSITTIKYNISDGTIKSQITKYNQYDNENRKIQEISMILTAALRVDTTTYQYENNELTSQLQKTYVDGSFSFCTKIEYSEFNGAFTTEITTSLDCISAPHTSSTTNWPSSNDLTPLDSARQTIYIAEQDSNFTMKIYDADFSVEDAILLDHNEYKYVNGGLSYDRTRLYYYHINPGAVSTEEVALSMLSLHPNPSSASFLINVTANSGFDQLQLYNAQGQLVRNIMTSVKRRMQVDAPEHTGLYFVVLLKDGKLIASPKQLVVK